MWSTDSTNKFSLPRPTEEESDLWLWTFERKTKERGKLDPDPFNPLNGTVSINRRVARVRSYRPIYRCYVVSLEFCAIQDQLFLQG